MLCLGANVYSLQLHMMRIGIKRNALRARSFLWLCVWARLQICAHVYVYMSICQIYVLVCHDVCAFATSFDKARICALTIYIYILYMPYIYANTHIHPFIFNTHEKKHSPSLFLCIEIAYTQFAWIFDGINISSPTYKTFGKCISSINCELEYIHTYT